jgi:glycogen operon protein
LAGDAIAEVDARGNRVLDDTLLILLNAYHQRVKFVLPAHRRKLLWRAVLDTAGPVPKHPMRGGEIYEVEARSVALLRLPQGGDSEPRLDLAGREARRPRRKASPEAHDQAARRDPNDFPTTPS